MKKIITFECDIYKNTDEMRAINNCFINQRFVDEFYDEVFRPIIKYVDDEELAEIYTGISNKLHDFLEELR